MQVTNSVNITFKVVLVFEGEEYGLKNCFINDGETLVEFYDTRFPHCEHGQFVTRYYVSTFMEGMGGVILDGGNRDVWFFNSENARDIRDFITKNT